MSAFSFRKTPRTPSRCIDTGGLLHPNVEVTLSAFMDAACEILPRRFRPDCCIAATRLAVDVLGGRHHLPVVPLTCSAWAFNPPAAAWLEREGDFPKTPEKTAEWHATGCWIVTVGEEDTPGDGWSGHLVALVAGRVLIDLALTQASRPDKGLLAHPLLAVTPEGFGGNMPEGDAPLVEAHYSLNGGGKVVYFPRPRDHSYAGAKDWNPRTHAGVFTELVQSMRQKHKRFQKGGAD